MRTIKQWIGSIGIASVALTGGAIGADGAINPYTETEQAHVLEYGEVVIDGGTLVIDGGTLVVD